MEKTILELLSQPVGLLATTVVLLIWFSRWLKPIIDRLIKRHLDFVDKLDATQDTLCRLATVHERKMEVVELATTKTTLQNDRIIKELENISSVLKQQNQQN